MPNVNKARFLSLALFNSSPPLTLSYFSDLMSGNFMFCLFLSFQSCASRWYRQVHNAQSPATCTLCYLSRHLHPSLSNIVLYLYLIPFFSPSTCENRNDTKKNHATICNSSMLNLTVC